MSMSTDAVLIISGRPSPELAVALLEPLPDSGGQRLGSPPDDHGQGGQGDSTAWTGGASVMSLRVYGAGFRHAVPHEIISWLRSLPWGHVGAVLVYEWEGQDTDFDASPTLKPVIINPPIDIQGLEKDGPMKGMWR